MTERVAITGSNKRIGLTILLPARTMTADEGFMTRIFAAFCFALLSFSAAHAADARASNIAPLAFGMTQQEASNALGAPLQLVAVQRRGGEVYFAAYDTRVMGYPIGERIVLQFRKGYLTGWKQDWSIRKLGPF